MDCPSPRFLRSRTLNKRLSMGCVLQLRSFPLVNQPPQNAWRHRAARSTGWP